jgi:hypothetical protein
MENGKVRYLKGRANFESNRPMKDVRVPSGQVFEVVRLEGLEVMEAWRIIGVDPEGIDDGKSLEIGMKMIAHTQQLLDEFVVRFVKAPILVASTAPAEEKKKYIVTTDLAAADKMALISGVMGSGAGAEGKALADKFPAAP